MKTNPYFRQSQNLSAEIAQLRRERQELKEEVANLKAELDWQIKNNAPSMYASMALALHRKFGWGFTRINRAFVESQHIWQNCDNVHQMFEDCYNETDIEICPYE